jgi:hypothetical protein
MRIFPEDEVSIIGVGAIDVYSVFGRIVVGDSAFAEGQPFIDTNRGNSLREFDSSLPQVGVELVELCRQDLFKLWGQRTRECHGQLLHPVSKSIDALTFDRKTLGNLPEKITKLELEPAHLDRFQDRRKPREERERKQRQSCSVDFGPRRAMLETCGSAGKGRRGRGCTFPVTES